MTERRLRLGTPTRTATDWEEAALDVIAARGFDAVSIPALASVLGVTKGSFYWHFSSLDDLIARAVKRWETLDNETLERIRGIADPLERMRALFDEATTAERAPALYLALAFAASRRFATTLRKVSERRLEVIADAYRELGLSDEESRRQALLAYSAYVGWLFLRNGGVPWLRSEADVESYLRHAANALLTRQRVNNVSRAHIRTRPRTKNQ